MKHYTRHILLSSLVLWACSSNVSWEHPVDDPAHDASFDANADRQQCVIEKGMTLPTSRNETYAAGSQLKSATMNDLQDAVINASHGPVDLPLMLSARVVSSGTWTVGTTGLLTENTDSTVVLLPVNIPVGDTMTGIRVRGIQAGDGSQFNIRLQAALDDGALGDVGGNATSSDGFTGTPQEVAVTLGSLPTFSDAARYFIRVATTGGGGANRTICEAYIQHQRDIP